MTLGRGLGRGRGRGRGQRVDRALERLGVRRGEPIEACTLVCELELRERNDGTLDMELELAGDGSEVLADDLDQRERRDVPERDLTLLRIGRREGFGWQRILTEYRREPIDVDSEDRDILRSTRRDLEFVQRERRTQVVTLRRWRFDQYGECLARIDIALEDEIDETCRLDGWRRAHLARVA